MRIQVCGFPICVTAVLALKELLVERKVLIVLRSPMRSEGAPGDWVVV